ncbi:tigger transposable element-derived protein 4-like [Parasteatoda tepidariorum]|uniref:tigger transposable element-derived protein 4-like n=1 Tax=Parasteatoda tepidariorum TaxID=114398 RepID=UPI0039BD1558
MTFKDENCSEGKMSKEHLTVLVGRNAPGTEKLPLLVIGKYRNPRCFKNVKTYPLDYKSNKKSWMTLVLLEDYVRKLDRKFFAKKRKVKLFMDKWTAHSDLLNLKAVNLQFLLPNTTAKLQPMDQGIIKCFKQSYRKRLVRKMMNDIENNISFKVDVLDAMRLLSSAWNNDVSETTIRNCFRKCGFFKETQSKPVIEEFQDEEITEENDDSAAEEEGSETIAPNILEARASLEVLQKFLESQEGIDNSMFVSQFYVCLCCVYVMSQKGLLQRKKTDYFKKT